MPHRSSDPIKASARKAKAQRRVGEGAKCTDCGESRSEVLVARSRPKRCYQCYQRARIKKTSELNHLAAKPNSRVKVKMPANEHRLLSSAQYEWPIETFRNEDGSPVLALAAGLRGIADFIEELIVRWLRAGAEFLERLDAWLREQHGKWWIGTPFEGWQLG